MSAKTEVEILQVADIVAREQGLEKETVLHALETALARPAELKYGERNDIEAKIDRDTGNISFARKLTVVAEVNNPYREIQFEQAKELNPDIQMGEVIKEELPITFDRMAAALSRQEVGDILKKTKRSQHFNEYKDRIGELVNVVIKRNEITFIMAEFGNKVEGIFLKDDLIPRENLQIGERVKAVIKSVNPESEGPVLRLSRTSPELLKALIAEEVTEVEEGIIEIKSAARDPGSRAKVAVYSPDTGVDAVGACIGVRGTRIHKVSDEMMGEKIDVISWSSDPATYVINALAPAKITKVILDEEKHTIEVVVPEDQLSFAIGRRGQNVKLASTLTGWHISIITEQKESERYQEVTEKAVSTFMEDLNVDELFGRLLATEGFLSIEDVADCEISELMGLEGLDQDLAIELQNRARTFLEGLEDRIKQEMQENNVNKDFINYEKLSFVQKKKLLQNDVKTLDDIADLAGDELLEMAGDDTLTRDDANAIIMELRSRSK